MNFLPEIHADETVVWNGQEWTTVEVKGVRMIQPSIPSDIPAKMGQYLMTDGEQWCAVPREADQAAVIAEGTERGLWYTMSLKTPMAYR